MPWARPRDPQFSSTNTLLFAFSAFLVLAVASSLSKSHPKPPSFSAAAHTKDKKYHLLLCATGSVATIKIPAICEALSTYSNLSIRVLLSESATKFLDGQSEEQPHWDSLKKIKNVDGVYLDRHEWETPWTRGGNILHIELRRWADTMVIAPLSSNALAKMVAGMSDNLIMSVVRAWDTTGLIDGVRPDIVLGGGASGRPRKTILVAPAMNTAMWHHPVTRKHVDVLVEEWSVQNGGWVELLPPIDKGLACGDAGSGGMKEWRTIVGDIERMFPELRREETAAIEGGE